MSSIRSVVAALVCLGLFASPPADARLPRTAATAIVPLVSIAGIKPGMTPAQVRARWGRPDRCTPGAAPTCTWAAGSYERATVRYRGGRAAEIGVGGEQAACRINPLVFRTLRRWRTANGLGLLSTVAEVRAGLPGVTGDGSDGAPLQVRRRTGSRLLRFGLFTGALLNDGIVPCPPHARRPHNPAPPDPYADRVTSIVLGWAR